VSKPTLYLFDGFNVLRAAGIDDPVELVDRLVSFVAVRGVRGILVFDGPGTDRTLGPLEIRYAPHADSVLERLAAENRDRERVLLVSSDAAVRGTSGQEVMKVTSKTFAAELENVAHSEAGPFRVAERLDPETRAQLERMRRSRK
jgi:predicted RNA-binding protein with PIN domain